MRLREAKIGMKVCHKASGCVFTVGGINEQTRRVLVAGDGGAGWKPKDLRPFPVTQPAHTFQVGDLVDCDEDKTGNTSAVIGGMIVGWSGGERLVKGVLYCGHYANKEKEASWVPCEFIRPHVPAPKAEPVKAPAESKPGEDSCGSRARCSVNLSGKCFQEIGTDISSKCEYRIASSTSDSPADRYAKKHDALESAKREAWEMWKKEPSIDKAINTTVEIGFRAGQKAGGDAIKALEDVASAKLKQRNQHNDKADKANAVLETLNRAIAILKGGE